MDDTGVCRNHGEQNEMETGLICRFRGIIMCGSPNGSSISMGFNVNPNKLQSLLRGPKVRGIPKFLETLIPVNAYISI